MFSEERERWKKFFDVFQKHFGEEVGFVPSVYESDDIDIDFIMGEESGKLFGLQVLQLFPDEEYEGDDDEDEDEDDEEEVDDEEEEDDDEPTGYVIEYTFIITDTKPEEIKDEKIYELDFNMETEGEAEKIHLDFFANKDDEFTAVIVLINEDFFGVFKEHPDFDF